jgi:hypothetical protein
VTSGAPSTEIDRSQQLLAAVRFNRAPTDQEFDQYLQDHRGGSSR